MATKWKYYSKDFVADRAKPEHAVWPWSGHRRFAYDLVRWLAPGRIAELGVHWGTSFFTFAQAIRDGKLATELVGVDTFQGDEQAGHYGEEVWGSVSSLVKRSFPRQKIVLHRMLFREALGLVEDESCDIIHIDGLHTYEAVKEDFESWLPKLRAEGVMLFHDVAPDTGYGSTTYWDELSAKFPGFAFEHSWGLGVLFPKGDAVLRDLRQSGLEDKLLVYRYRAEAERSRIEKSDLALMASQRYEAIQAQSNVIQERTRWARGLEQKLEHADRELAGVRREGAEKTARQDEQIRALNERLSRMKLEAEAAGTLAKERYETMQKMGARLGELSAERERLTKSVSELGRRAQDSAAQLAATEARLQKLATESRAAGDLARERYEVILRQGERLGGLTSQVSALSGRVEEGRKEAARLGKSVAALTGARDALAARNKELEMKIDKLSERIAGVEADIELLLVRADNADRAIVEQRRESKELREMVEAPASVDAGAHR